MASICKKCAIPFTRGEERLCVECWIIENQVEDEAAARIRAGEVIHTVNCRECRKVNRIYCPKCVD